MLCTGMVCSVCSAGEKGLIPQAHRAVHGFSGKGILAHARKGYQGGPRIQVGSDRTGADARGEQVEYRVVGGVSCVEASEGGWRGNTLS